MHKENIRAVIATGGTGGHIFPGIAIAQALLKAGVKEVMFLGRANSLEQKIVYRYGYPFKDINSAGIMGKKWTSKIKGAFQVGFGIGQCLYFLKHYRPKIVLGLGSYTSAPALIAAKCLGIPIVVHEQNLIPGVANRILGKWAERVCLSFKETTFYFPQKKYAITGNPVREEIINVHREKGEERLRILVLGGSQGAHSINQAFLEAWEELKHWQGQILLTHQTGERDYVWVKRTYEKVGTKAHVVSFIYNMAEVYAKTDLIIGRAGATSLAEITTLGIPSILIPFPLATHQHQFYNAKRLALAGAAIVIRQDQLNGKFLAEKITNFLKNRQLLQFMAKRALSFGTPQAGEKIAALCKSIIKGN